MSLTDEGHYGPKPRNLLQVNWGEGDLYPGGSEELEGGMGEVDVAS